MCLHWKYFPFPSVRNGKFHNGMIQSWPSECTECIHKYCLLDEVPINDIQRCDCGLNYIRVKEGFTVGGLKISSDPGNSPLINDSNGSLHVSSENILTAITPHTPSFDFGTTRVQLWNCNNIPEISQELSRQVNFIESYRGLVNDLLQRLKEDIESPEMPLENNYYRQMFWRCKYFNELLATFEFIYDPSILIKTYKCVPLKPAPLVKKQIFLISSRYHEKNLKFSFSSESSKLITVHPQVISSLIFNLIDNAAKFAPEKSEILISLKDNNSGTIFSVTSIGPEIPDHESEDIYKAEYTGKASSSPDSPGLGLYIAFILVNNHLKSNISHHQEKLKTNKFATTFTIDIPEKAGILF